MRQLQAVWSGLDMRRRVVVIAATVAMFAAVIGLARVASAPSMTLLYSGLEPLAAGEIVQVLEQQGTRFEIRGNAIFVESGQRDQLRMSLAGQGLPANGAAGYELLDSLSGFGTTSQMFDAAYWRAKEGELARTITASPHIRAARVHIANVTSNPFQRNQTPSASVTVTPSGSGFGDEQAKALRFLVASAVAGLVPDNVSVIDAETGRVLEKNGSNGAANPEESAEIKARVERILEARVGPGAAIVEVSVERATERESIVERRFDPESRVAISTDTEERTRQSSDQADGAVTVASNLPTGDAGAAGQSSSQDNETRERVNFEVSETQREILREPGTLKRLSVAVLVDGVRTVAADGTASWAPRPDEEMADLLALVQSAVGFDEARGDSVTIRSLEFEKPGEVGTLAEDPGLIGGTLDLMTLIQLGVLAVASLILGLFVVRPILTREVAPLALALDADPARSPGLQAAQPNFADATVVRADASLGEIVDGAGKITNAPVDLEKDADVTLIGPEGAPLALGNPGSTPEFSDPLARLRQLISEREEEGLEILNDWVAPVEAAE